MVTDSLPCHDIAMTVIYALPWGDARWYSVASSPCSHTHNFSLIQSVTQMAAVVWESHKLLGSGWQSQASTHITWYNHTYHALLLQCLQVTMLKHPTNKINSNDNIYCVVSSTCYSRWQTPHRNMSMLHMLHVFLFHITCFKLLLYFKMAHNIIKFKVATLTFCCLHVWQTYTDLWQLQSASTSTQHPTRQVTISDHAFGIAIARICNSLPPLITTSTSLPIFERQLKMLLFKHPLDCNVCLFLSMTLSSAAHFEVFSTFFCSTLWHSDHIHL